MSAWIKSEELAIQHLGKSGQWMPATDVFGKKPDDIVKGKSGKDMLILTDILIVIVIYEIEITHLPKDSEGDYRQSQINKVSPICVQYLIHIQ